MPEQTEPIVDLRSDTVTRPTAEMRRAMVEAPLGDDVFGDDPTVNTLEARVAAMFGKEAALFVPSGTQGNLVALSAIMDPGDEIILDRQCHIFNYEVASAAMLAGVQTNPLDGERGVITAEMVSPHIRPDNLHCPPTTTIALENTHNRAGGHVVPLGVMQGVRALASERGLKVHIDGARIANAHVASGVSFRDYGDCCDTLSMCFSKGLGAPVGSIVVSTQEIIDRGRRIRKRLGGGMRQAGVLAAAAGHALDHHVARLAQDHANAQRLAGFIEAMDGAELTHPVESNIVIFRLDPAAYDVEGVLANLKNSGVLAVPFGPGLVRMVTHLGVSDQDVTRVGEVLPTLARN